MSRFASGLVFAAVLAFGSTARAGDLSPEQDRRYQALTHELRCLVCQNESIAESEAPLAGDLRDQVKMQIVEGRSDAQIVGYLTDRYGDFVLYKPRFKANTALLWLMPALLIAAGLVAAVRLSLKRRRAPTPAVDAEALRRLLAESDRKRS